MDAIIQQAVSLLEGFNEKEQNFALNVLKQIPERRITEDSYVCDYGYVHGDFNDETKEAFEECEEIIRQIEAGERVPRFNSVAELMADLMSEDDDDDEDEIWDRAVSQVSEAV